MIQLVYVSSAVKECTEEEILEILEVSRKNNKERNITGMLLYISGNFIQILEGSEKEVNEIFDKILKDERHKDVTLICKKPADERIFPDWSMGFKYFSKRDKIEGYTEFLTKNLKPRDFANKNDVLIDLLYTFKASNT